MTDDQLLSLFRIIFNIDDNGKKWKEKMPEGTDVMWSFNVLHSAFLNEVNVIIKVTMLDYNDTAKRGEASEGMSLSKRARKDYDHLFKKAFMNFRKD